MTVKGLELNSTYNAGARVHVSNKLVIFLWGILSNKTALNMPHSHSPSHKCSIPHRTHIHTRFLQETYPAMNRNNQTRITCEVPVIMFLMKSLCPGASMMVT